MSKTYKAIVNFDRAWATVYLTDVPEEPAQVFITDIPVGGMENGKPYSREDPMIYFKDNSHLSWKKEITNRYTCVDCAEVCTVLMTKEIV